MRIEHSSDQLEQIADQLDKKRNELIEVLDIIDLCINNFMDYVPLLFSNENSFASFNYQIQKKISDARSISPMAAALTENMRKISNTFIEL